MPILKTEFSRDAHAQSIPSGAQYHAFSSGHGFQNESTPTSVAGWVLIWDTYSQFGKMDQSEIFIFALPKIFLCDFLMISEGYTQQNYIWIDSSSWTGSNGINFIFANCRPGAVGRLFDWTSKEYRTQCHSIQLIKTRLLIPTMPQKVFWWWFGSIKSKNGSNFEPLS